MKHFFELLNPIFSCSRSRNSSRLSEQANTAPPKLLLDCIEWSQAGKGKKGDVLKINIFKDENISGITRAILLDILGHKSGRRRLEDIGFKVIDEGTSGYKKKKLIIANSTFDQNTPDAIASAIHTLQKQLR